MRNAVLLSDPQYLCRTLKNKTDMRKIIKGEGTPIRNTQDIREFCQYMMEKYNIKEEVDIIPFLIGEWESDPSNKQHLVMRNKGDEWFCSWLSDEEVLGRQEIQSNQKFLDGCLVD